jgi:sulfur carrier protein ThiS
VRTVKVTVRTLANLRHYLPDAREERNLEIPEATTLADILELVSIPRPEVYKAAVNGSIVGLNHIPAEGDRIDFFPILAGG